MEKVIVLPELYESLESLISILYNEEYFGFKESAIAYVDKIYDFIYTIPRQKKRKTRNNKHGAWYCTYKANPHTTYFITFDTENDIYLIKYITNNHTINYPQFIKLK